MQIDRFYTNPTADHVPLDQLRRYQTDALPLNERYRVEKHLLHCDLCADVLAGLEASPELVTQRAVQEINRRLATSLARQRKVVPFYADSKNWGVAAAVLFFIMSGIAVFYYNLGQINQAEKSLADKAAAAQPKTETVVKPALPQTQVAETTKPEVLVDSTQEGSVLAFRRPGVSRSPVQAALPNATAPLASASDNSPSLNSRPMPYQLVPDTPALAAAPNLAVESQLSGRVAGVAASSNIRISGNKVGALRDSSSLTGRVATGKVTDENGGPLPGVTIIIKGTTTGTITDASGNYELPLPDKPDKVTLVYNFVGFTTLERFAQPGAVADVRMAVDARALSEVVVVGYGTASKANVNETVTYARPSTGFKAFKKYIQANIKYPETAHENKVKGRVVVGFTVDPNGNLSDFRIIKSLSPACDAEALRLIREGPQWEPTKKGATAINEQVRVAIRFKPLK